MSLKVALVDQDVLELQPVTEGEMEDWGILDPPPHYEEIAATVLPVTNLKSNIFK